MVGHLRRVRRFFLELSFSSVLMDNLLVPKYGKNGLR
jgi:hypothetical protein